MEGGKLGIVQFMDTIIQEIVQLISSAFVFSDFFLIIILNALFLTAN